MFSQITKTTGPDPNERTDTSRSTNRSLDRLDPTGIDYWVRQTCPVRIRRSSDRVQTGAPLLCSGSFPWVDTFSRLPLYVCKKFKLNSLNEKRVTGFVLVPVRILITPSRDGFPYLCPSILFNPENCVRWTVGMSPCWSRIVVRSTSFPGERTRWVYTPPPRHLHLRFQRFNFCTFRCRFSTAVCSLIPVLTAYGIISPFPTVSLSFRISPPYFTSTGTSVKWNLKMGTNPLRCTF